MALSGCTARPSPPPVSPRSQDPCLLTAGESPPADTLRVALLEPVDLSRPWQPSNDSERLLFRFLSSTLVRLDCRGNLHPELARSWTTEDQGRVWTFTLADSALDRLRMPVSADRIVASLRPRLNTIAASSVDSVTSPTDGQLRVFLRQGDTLPLFLADPAFSLPDSVDSYGTNDEAIIRVPAGANRPVLEFRLARGSDPRDALDRGADLLVTRSSQLIDYARGRSGWTDLPLPWSRTYMLVQGEGTRPLQPSGQAERQSMARDAVEADARVADLPPWLAAANACPEALPDTAPVRANRIAYEIEDEVARDLAERVVALTSPATPVRALGLPSSDFLAHLRRGSELAYVVAVPSRTLAPCQFSNLLPLNPRVEPLIETRAHVLFRKGVPPLTVDWDGTVRLATP